MNLVLPPAGFGIPTDMDPNEPDPLAACNDLSGHTTPPYQIGTQEAHVGPNGRSGQERRFVRKLLILVYLLW
jgi:hypothetical protein